MRVQNIWNKGLARVQGAGRRGVLCRKGMCLSLHAVRTLLRGCLQRRLILLQVSICFMVEIAHAQVQEDKQAPSIWTNIQTGDIYTIWNPPVILVSVTDDVDPHPSVEIFLNNEPYYPGTKVEQPGIYRLKVIACDASGNQSRILRTFQVDDYISLIGKASTLYWHREGENLEAIVIHRLRDLYLDPHTKGITPQVAMCEYLPTSLTLVDRFGNAVNLVPYRESSYVDEGRIGLCCEMVTPIILGVEAKDSEEVVVAHFVGKVSQNFEISSVELVGWGRDVQDRDVISFSRIPQLVNANRWETIVSELNRRKRCRPGGGSGGNRPCTLPRARLTKRLLEECQDTCRQIDNQPYDCLPCFSLNDLYCSGHFISCIGAECDGFAEARDNSRPCYASTIGNADDYISWLIRMETADSGNCPCEYRMQVVTRPTIKSKGSISWGGEGTLALSAGAVIVSVVGACSLQCEVVDAVGVGSIEGTEVELGISRGPQGGSGSISIPIRIGQGNHYDETKRNQCSCEGPGMRVTVHLSAAARAQTTANGPVGAFITVSSYAEVSTASNTSIWGIIQCDANQDPRDGKETVIIVGPVTIP
ncbi:hypothetical protein HRbin15_02056 [bacterium HR15]|nr:hypothetical protein HRbin15_02056 [bacterium HR15]